MQTSIIVLAQQLPLLKSCLASIELFTESPYELIVINDGGDKEISSYLAFSKRARSFATNQPAGVAAGYNLGASLAGGEHLIFMRDHMMVSEDWLSSLNGCARRHPGAAMVGPVSNDVSGPQRLPVQCSEMEQLDHIAKSFALSKAGQAKTATRLLSHLLLVRHRAFDELGGFDERFEMECYEDDDLCYRALQAGYSLHIALDCFVRYIQPPPLFPDDPNWYNTRLSLNREKARQKWGFDITSALYEMKRKATVSLCMIVKNEEATLKRCLDSVACLVDEIIIVDTGSTDLTKEIALRYTDKVADFTWVDDFSKARNYAFSLATQDYLLWMDADDIFLPADAEKFTRLTAALDWDTDAVSMNYNLAFDEHGNLTSSLTRNRLVKRENGFRWHGVVHEYLEVSGKVHRSDISITHGRMHGNSSRNLNIYENRYAAGEIFSSRDLYYFANELREHKQWLKAISFYEMFLQQVDSWVEDRINACGSLSDCFRELGNIQDAKAKALQAFSYDLPRAESCCRLGSLYMLENDFSKAIFWYKLASGLTKPADSYSILQHACWSWLPHLQLCVCYDRIGQYERACAHNEKAAEYIPNDSKVLANRAYFTGLGVAVQSYILGGSNQ
ncbi:glycosyltransferase [Paenibacillus sp. S150]|uniref:glycosyltransferase n=1 Tax=Paenibacillus sp. S150 TaxID=2749826 RepID=UPI001C594B01|nr:glycosyltransferase [Paenibacillus sp. S150]MBW4082756.1 glycosyltransferase [Paenibacillus sp. S150]